MPLQVYEIGKKPRIFNLLIHHDLSSKSITTLYCVVCFSGSVMIAAANTDDATITIYLLRRSDGHYFKYSRPDRHKDKDVLTFLEKNKQTTDDSWDLAFLLDHNVT